MKRYAETVLNGHPDRFCDLIADRVVHAICRTEPDAYAQIEVSVWSDLILLTGGAVTRQGRRPPLREIIVELGQRIGFTRGNHIDVEQYRVMDEICHIPGDPREWTNHVNDQSIVVGYAGYDALTRYLPPEQFLAGWLREAVVAALEEGPLQGEGPDGKLLVVLREEPDGWHPENLLLTLQHRPTTAYVTIVAQATQVLREAWERLRRRDPRWTPEWRDIPLLVNPNGPFHEGGSDSNNGQTGRKTAIDHYGPRIPIGGGALYGKHLSHIDRIGAFQARRLAIESVRLGATVTRIYAGYAPGMDKPLSIDLQSDKPPHTDLQARLQFQEMHRGVRISDLDYDLRRLGTFYNPDISAYPAAISDTA